MTFWWSPAARAHGLPAPVVKRVLYEFDGPKMVLAVDGRGRQLLGVAADEDGHGVVRWVFAPAAPEHVASLLATRAGLRELFERGMLEICDIEPPWTAVRAWTVAASDVPEDLLPAPDAELPELS